MAEHGSIKSPKDNYRRPISSIFSSPRPFTPFVSKGLIDTEAILSPTSTLDTKPFSGSRNPFSPKSPKPEIRTYREKLDSRKVGLGILDALIDEKTDPVSEPESRVVLFGSQLKIKIPPIHLSPGESPKKSPADFGIKTRNSQLGLFSPGVEKKSPFGSASSGLGNPFSPRVISASEMELSEEYTRVVSHGPNPRTTHIFDDCIVESCCGVVGFSDRRKGDQFCGGQSMSYPSENFLNFCYGCKKNLGQGNDVYMYRGEKAFCSSECRCKEMMLDEKRENFHSDDVYGASL